MAQPINQQQPQTNQPQQPIGLDVNATLRTKEGLYIQGIRFNSTACKFLVLKATYVNGSNPKQDCYLTANFTTQGANRGISLHLFDALNAQNWKIDDWSKAVKTSLNINKLRKPTPDEAVLVEALKKNEKDVGLQVFWKNPTVVEAAYSLNNPQTGTNSANKQNQIDNGMGSKPKQPSAAVQGAIEGMSEKNPALESTELTFDRIIRESHDEIENAVNQAFSGGYDYASDTINDEDDILCGDIELRATFNDIYDNFANNDRVFDSWKSGYIKYVCQFLEIDHSVDYDSDYIHESVESDKEEFTNYVNNLFNDTGNMEVGKCPDCGMMLTDEDELEDGTHECPNCGAILEDHEFNDISGSFWDEEDEPDFWEIEDEDR